MTREKIVVTGMSLITSVGLDMDSSWEALKAGRSGVRSATGWDLTRTPTRIAAQLPPTFDALVETQLSPEQIAQTSRTAQTSILLARQMLQRCPVDFSRLNRRRIGVILGTGGHHGADATMVDSDPWAALRAMPSAPAAWISLEYGLEGPSFTVNSACAAGGDGLGVAWSMLQSGRLDMVITGGIDVAVNFGSVKAFNHLMALSEANDVPEKASRPFDKNRNGFVAGEGGGMVLLERESHARARGAEILCEHVGYASLNEASNIMAPKEGGEGMALAMSSALRETGIDPEEVHYISAHGTSTAANDRCETQGIKLALGPHAYRVAISSQKSMVGHTFGGAGGLEFVVSALSIMHDFATPTINYETPDPDCDLDYVPNVGRAMHIRVALSNSFGFGGHDVTHVLRKYQG